MVKTSRRRRVQEGREGEANVVDDGGGIGSGGAEK